MALIITGIRESFDVRKRGKGMFIGGYYEGHPSDLCWKKCVFKFMSLVYVCTCISAIHLSIIYDILIRLIKQMPSF